MKTKEFIITNLLVFLILIIFNFFPTNNKIQQLIAVLIFFICIPLLYYKIILKKPLFSLGLQIGDWKKGVLFSSYSFFAAGFVLLIFIKYSDFLKNYFVPRAIIKDFTTFIFYEFFGVLLIVFIYDFFFRGFFMFNINQKINYYLGLFLQAALFLVFMWATKTSLWLILPYLVFSPFAGLIAYKSRSIFYSTVTQFLIIFIFDASFIKMIK
jgi:membrane protease YdiL (CAAX protease family)